MFDVDWFSEHTSAWLSVLQNLPIFRGGSTASSSQPRLLFVGVHEGRAPHWVLQTLAPSARITVVDDFKYPDCVWYRGREVKLSPVRAKFERAMASVGRKVSPSTQGRPSADSRVVRVVDDLRSLRCEDESFDFVYVDAQSSKQVLDTLVRVFPLVKRGGVFVVTNNVHGRLHDAACPKRGIQGFLDAYITDVKVLRDAFHLFFERRKRPLSLPHPCRYEIFDGQESFDDPDCGGGGGRGPRHQAKRPAVSR